MTAPRRPAKEAKGRAITRPALDSLYKVPSNAGFRGVLTVNLTHNDPALTHIHTRFNVESRVSARGIALFNRLSRLPPIRNWSV